MCSHAPPVDLPVGAALAAVQAQRARHMQRVITHKHNLLNTCSRSRSSSGSCGGGGGSGGMLLVPCAAANYEALIVFLVRHAAHGICDHKRPFNH
jgi:hypothetical protein